MMGSAALNMCAVASGDADGYFEYTLHCWDMAGGKIIVEEAGGVVIDPEGKLFSFFFLCFLYNIPFFSLLTQFMS